MSGQMNVKKCDVQPFLLLPTVLYLCLLLSKLFMVGPYLLSLLDVGIALQGLITQVHPTGWDLCMLRLLIVRGCWFCSTSNC